jgi:hypothetical protein
LKEFFVKIEIVKELESMCLEYEKKQNRGSSFKPFRYHKYKNGEHSPVFFVGSPGISVAIFATILIVVSMYIISLPFKWWIWLLYILLSGFFLKLTLKMDKAKQLRTLALALSFNAIKIIELVNKEEKNKEETIKLLEKAKEFLENALKWVEEPSMEKQLEILNKHLEKLKAP